VVRQHETAHRLSEERKEGKRQRQRWRKKWWRREEKAVLVLWLAVVEPAISAA
jgi:hypothetical protein